MGSNQYFCLRTDVRFPGERNVPACLDSLERDPSGAILQAQVRCSRQCDGAPDLNLCRFAAIQAWDDDLDDVAGLTPTDSNFIVGDGTDWVAETGATVRTSLGVGTGDSPTFAGVTIDSTAITGHLTGTASLDFSAWSGTDCQDLTVTVTGAADGDTVTLGIPNALASTAVVTWFGFVSASNTVTVRGCKISSGGSADPSAATVRADVWQH